MYYILHLSTTYHPSSCDYSRFRLGEPVGCLESRPRLAWPSHATRLSLKLPEQLCCSGIRTANLQIDNQEKVPLRHGADIFKSKDAALINFFGRLYHLRAASTPAAHHEVVPSHHDF